MSGQSLGNTGFNLTGISKKDITVDFGAGGGGNKYSNHGGSFNAPQQNAYDDIPVGGSGKE